jgi:polyphosphate kinase 2 (PPK2 family)
LQRTARERKVSTILVFEGWDAAGKGGSIRRITAALDARDYQVIQIAAPTDEEAAHNYLWRFWRHLPRAGRVTIYDRSWYGRVLVERIEGFARHPRMATRLCRDQRLRGAVGGTRHRAAEILAAHHRRRTVAPVSGARAKSATRRGN